MPRHAVPVTIAVLLTLVACSNSPASSPPTTSGRAPTTAAPATSPPTTEGSSPTAASATTDTPTTIPSTTVRQGVDPNAPEVVEPGDIPDNQVFVPFQPNGEPFSVKVPEGWAQTGDGTPTTFTDHYNSITIDATTATQAPTPDDVRSGGLADVADNATFKLDDVTTVQRRGGDGVLATYEIGSDPDPVTGKRALLAVERYEFFHAGTLVTLTLSGAKGADNVDPWRTVTDSLAWT